MTDSDLVLLNHRYGKNQFLNCLATSLANDDPDKAILSSRFIFVLGASGSGKTTLSAKFAARIAQESDNRLVALGQLGVHKDLHMDSLKSFSRLINVPNATVLLRLSSFLYSQELESCHESFGVLVSHQAVFSKYHPF